MGKKRFVCAWLNNWQACIEHKIFSLEEAGILVILQAYTRPRNNVVRDIDTGIPLMQKEIATLVGLSDKQTTRILNNLVEKNAVAKEKNGTAVSFILSPVLFWAGTEKDREYAELMQKFWCYIKEREHANCKNCVKPCLVWVSGRKIPVKNVRYNGQKCPVVMHKGE